MRHWLVALTFTLLQIFPALAQKPFPAGAPVTFKFTETIRDKVVPEPDTAPADQSFLVGAGRTILIQGSAPLNGFDLSQIDFDTVYSISVGNFETGQITGLQGRLSDDENFDPTKSSVSIPVMALNYDGDEVPIGSVALSWNTTRVNFTVSIGNLNQELTEVEYEIAADFYREQNDADISTEELTAAFTFGPELDPFTFDLRTVYTVGTASTSEDARVPDTLSQVTLNGSIDDVPPTVTINNPPANEKVSSAKLTISGSASDTRKIGTTTYNGTVHSVEVQVGTNTDAGEFEEVELTGNKWTLPDVELEPGENFITARAMDADGNVTTTSKQKVTLLSRGPITVRALAENFPPGASGVVGTVSAAFFTRNPKTMSVSIEDPVEQDVRSNVVAGQFYKVAAKPAPGSVFNGWIGTINGSPVFTSVEEVLTFETKPNLILEARFVPNPFAPVLGTYHGIITGDNPAERGVFKIAINQTGAFSGKVQVGKLVLPVRGKVLGSGFWQGMVKKSSTVYTVSFNLELGPDEDRQLVGTVTGGGLTADIAADLLTWRKAKKNVPGNLPTEYLGSYNVLLRPPVVPVANVPAGIGFGKVTVTTLGGIVFVGRLGDGTPFKAGATLVERNSGGVFFPLYLGLVNKTGSLSGTVEFVTTAESDLSAVLDWQKPPTKKAEPQAFADQISLEGSRYTPPSGGQRVILQASGGQGWATILAPGYSVPANPPGQLLDVKSLANLAPTQLVTLSNPALQSLLFKMKFNAKTGFFAGSYQDPHLNKTVRFTGAALQKSHGGAGFAAGVLVRGNRAGAITLGPPPPE